MQYKIIKLYFQTGVHFGNGSLAQSAQTIHGDTLFSALCQEALKLEGEEGLERFVQLAKERKVQFSDAFPFIGEELYLPKPMKMTRENEEEVTREKKTMKKLHYIPVSGFENFLKGKLDARKELEKLGRLGKHEVKTSAAIFSQEDAVPYSVGVYHFQREDKSKKKEPAGLYFLFAYEEEEDSYYVGDLIDGLSYSGIGGRRSSGLGKFRTVMKEVPKDFLLRLTERTWKNYMTLNLSMAQDQELEKVLEEASYQLKKRGGFIASNTYTGDEGYLKKKDMYFFDTGSCFGDTFLGDIFDVSGEGNHPVYRYGIPMFLGVN